MQTSHPVKVLATDTKTAAIATAQAAAPTAGQMVNVVGALIVIAQLAAQAAAGFDVILSGLEGGDITIPCANSGAAGSVVAIPISFAHPIRPATSSGQPQLQGTPTANTRMSLTLFGFVSP